MTRGDLAILAEGLEKSHGNTRALDGLNLTVEEGTVLGLLGPNGAGKTTARFASSRRLRRVASFRLVRRHTTDLRSAFRIALPAPIGAVRGSVTDAAGCAVFLCRPNQETLA